MNMAVLFLEDTTAITDLTVRFNVATGGQGTTDGQGVGGGNYIDDSLVSVEGLMMSNNTASTSDNELFGSFIP